MNQQGSPVQADNKLEIPGEIRTFLEGLLADSGMQIVDNEMHEEMIKELFARLDNFITSTIMDNLPPDQLEAFIKLNEEGKSRAEVEQFLKDKIPNTQEVMTKAFMEFRDLYLGNVTAARNAPGKPDDNTGQTTQEKTAN